MASIAAATHLGASSCFGLRPSQTIRGVGSDGTARTGTRNGFSFGRVRQRNHYRPQRLFHCVTEDASADAPAAPPAAPPVAPKETPNPSPKAAVEVPKKPTFTMKKGQIVRVDKEKYLNSIEYYALAHPKFFKGIDYIYQDRGEILDLRFFEAGEYALVTWAGIPTAPAWLPTYMLIKVSAFNSIKMWDMQSEKLSYKRM